MTFTPRGWHDSEGEFTAAGAIADAGAAFAWLHDDEETWLPQLEHMHLPLYRALRA